MAAADLFDLTDKVAVITGGAGGIGVVYAEALAEAGASVVVADVDHRRRDEGRRGARRQGPRSHRRRRRRPIPESAAAMARPPSTRSAASTS